MKELFLNFCLICICFSSVHGAKVGYEKLHASELNKSSYSVNGRHRTSVLFKNSTDSIRKIYWLDYKGERKLYKVLKKGESYTQHTYVTHPWLVTCEDDIATNVYYPDFKRRVIELKEMSLDERLRGIKSIEGKEKTVIKIRNQFDKPVYVYWIDYKGERRLKRVLKPNETFGQNTFLTHPWLVTSANHKLLNVYYPDSSKRVIELKSAKGSPPRKDTPVAGPILDLTLRSKVKGVVDSKGRSYRVINKPKWIPGPSGIGQALQFTPDSSVDLGNQGNFERNQKFSYSAWVKLDQNAFIRNGALVAKMNQWNSCRGWDLYMISGQICFHFIHQWPNNGIKVVTEQKLKANTWSHVAVTYNGSSKAEGVKVYINGKAQKLQVLADSLTQTTKSTVPLTLGRRTANHSLTYGAISDFKLFGYALTPNQVSVIANPSNITKPLKIANVKVPKKLLVDLPLHSKEQGAIGRRGRSYRILNQPKWIEGPSGVGKALQFAPNSSLELGNIGNFERDQRFSYSAWIKLDQVSSKSAGALIAKMNAMNFHRGWDLWLRSGRLSFHFIHHYPQNAIKVSALQTVKANTWTHVTVTYDGSSKASGVKMYINGKEQRVHIDQDNLTKTTQSKVPLTLGKRTPGQALTNGAIREFKLFNFTLTPNQVSVMAHPNRLTRPEKLYHVKKNELREMWFGVKGKQLGFFLQTGPKTWKINWADSKGEQYKLNEVHRDRWSVYLHDQSRGVRFQLDLSTRKIYYSDVNIKKVELYQAIRSSNKTNGWVATEVIFGAAGKRLGTFRQSGKKSWKEISADPKGKNFDFEEMNRDHWSVYLVDRSRGVYVQLDLHTRKIYYRAKNSPKRELYQVLNASAKPNGWTVTEVKFGHSQKQLGIYRQIEGKQWKEIATQPNGVNFNFTEIGRDEWSVYLKDESRGVFIQLDLHTKKVYYRDSQSPRREQYQIMNNLT